MEITMGRDMVAIRGYIFCSFIKYCFITKSFLFP